MHMGVSEQIRWITGDILLGSRGHQVGGLMMAPLSNVDSILEGPSQSLGNVLSILYANISWLFSAMIVTLHSQGKKF